MAAAIEEEEDTGGDTKTLLLHQRGPEEDNNSTPTVTRTPTTIPPPPIPPPLHLICDLGSYGLPSESRPRQEKIRAMARQLVHFLYWRCQQQQQQQHNQPHAPIWIVLGGAAAAVAPTSTPSKNTVGDDTDEHKPPSSVQLDPTKKNPGHRDSTDADAGTQEQQLLLKRMKEVWQQQQQQLSNNNDDASKTTTMLFPEHEIVFTEQSLDCVVSQFLQTFKEDSEIEGDGNSIGDNNKNTNGPAPSPPALSDSNSSSSSNTTNTRNYYYLSPDATTVLDAAGPPPRLAVIGLLIDSRRVQTNRSIHRAAQLDIPTARWPLDQDDVVPSLQLVSSSSREPTEGTAVVDGSSSTTTTTTTTTGRLHPHEPLNVDTVLEGMQQWHWNYYSNNTARPRHAFRDAAVQAIRRHQERHPQRPWHLAVQEEAAAAPRLEEEK